METKSAAVAGHESKKKVLVAIDESEGSFYALKWVLQHLTNCAVSTSNQPGQDEITLVHVQQPFQNFIYPVGPGGVTFYATTSMMDSVRKAQSENSTAVLSRALQLCNDKMVKAETLILEGEPKEMICQAADQMHVDFLVVGSRGLGKIQRAFLGSVSDYCAHHAKCAVLIVKPPKEGTSKTGGGH